jgi:L-ascorbate metabolism protein UlaG (beta-lactamase superfamily)
MGVKLLEKLRWLGHDSFRYVGPPVLYFDPWRLDQDQPEADIVLVSHEHGDHCSPEDVERVSGPGTVIIANRTAAPSLRDVGLRAAGPPRDVRVMHPGETLVLGEVTVEAVPAYNITKYRSPGVPFHPQSALHNGYVVTVGGERIYFAGDTDHIPEMASIACDVALLPVSGTYVMTAEEAAEAARTIGPRVAVPMHYGAGVVGTAGDAARFAALYKGEVLVF